MVGQAVKQCGGHFWVAKHSLPFDEAKIEQEKCLVERAQRIVTVSEKEAAFFSQVGVPVEVLVHSVDATPTPRSFAERYGFIFIGPIVNDQTPNADALRYLLSEVWPKIRAALPNATLQVIGTNDLLESFQSLCAGGVEFLGRISEHALFDCADRARVHIVPTRFNAGVPLKAMTLAALGLPMVTTRMIQEQLGWTRGELVPADWQDAGHFGEACVRLHEDPTLWMSVREQSLAAVSQLADPAKFRADLAKITD